MIVILDIDGVMIPTKSWIAQSNLEDGFPPFGEKAVKALNAILTAETKIILSTSHKTRFTISEWKSIFDVRGIHLPHLDLLPLNQNNLSRKEEIVCWLNSESIDHDFIIIDDDKSLNDLPPQYKKYLILTNPMIGLNEDHVVSILQMVEFNLTYLH